MQGRRPIQASSGARSAHVAQDGGTSKMRPRVRPRPLWIFLVRVLFRGWLSEGFPPTCNNFFTHILNRLNLLSHCSQ